MLRKTNIQALKTIKSDKNQELAKIAREAKSNRFANLEMA